MEKQASTFKKDKRNDETTLLLPRTESNSDSESDDSEIVVTYASLWSSHRPFRLLFVGWNLTIFGEWFNYVAAMTLLKRIVNDPENDKTAIAVLVVLWLLPEVIFSGVGGLLADLCDRRWSMIVLDVLAGCLGLMYLTAFDSMILVYLISFLKMTTGALYEPCAGSIFPMLLDNAHELKKATTLCVFFESLLAALGPALGGLAVSMWGLTTCFVLDSLLCFGSALLTWLVGGSWDPSDEEDDTSSGSSEDEENGEGGDSSSTNSEDEEAEEEGGETFLQTLRKMAVGGVRYLMRSFFGPLVFLNCSSALIYGSLDVLEVSFSERGPDESRDSLLLGTLFSLSGLGDLLGTIIAEYFTDVKNPSSLQRACVWSFFSMAVAFLGMGIFPAFVSPCIFTVVDSAGATVIEFASELLLQLYTRPKMLGRVLAIDITLSTTTEIISAMLAGWVQDTFHVSAQSVSLGASVIGFSVFLSWFVFHRTGHGAASLRARAHAGHFSKAPRV